MNKRIRKKKYKQQVERAKALLAKKYPGKAIAVVPDIANLPIPQILELKKFFAELGLEVKLGRRR